MSLVSLRRYVRVSQVVHARANIILTDSLVREMRPDVHESRSSKARCIMFGVASGWPRNLSAELDAESYS